MKDTLAAGITTTRRVTVDRDRTIEFMGEDLRVYSTPAMLTDIERICRELILEHLDAGEDTVGSHVTLDHLGATLVNSWVDVEVTVTGVEGRRVNLEVEVRDPLDTVGRARHIRFVIDKARQQQRLEAKAAKLRESGD